MKNWKYKELFEELFRDKKVVLSSEITNLIKEKYPECSSENARNIIRSAQNNGTIVRVEKIVVEHNSYLYCTSGVQYTKKDVKRALCNDSTFNTIVNIFEKNKGIISYLDIYKLSGCLISKGNAHSVGIEQIVNKLNYIFLCKTVSFEENLFLIDGDKYHEYNTEWVAKARKMVNQAKIECLMIRSVIYSLKRQNIVNDVVPLYRNERQPLKGVSFNNLMFDAVAYSSVPAFVFEEHKTRSDNTIVLLDIAVSQTYSMSNFKGFYNRIQIIKNGVKTQKRSVVPIVVALTLDKEVKNVCRKMGILTYQLADLFGNKIGEMLSKLATIQVSDISQNSEVNIDSIADLLKMIEGTGQDENLENLRGTLFEYFMHSVIYKWLGGYIAGGLITGKKIVYDEKNKYSYEFDIIAPLKDEYLIIELKGYANSKFFRWGKKEESGKFEKETLGWFFRETFPVAKKYYEKNPENKVVKACFITTAHFDTEAKQKLESIKNGALKSQYVDIAYDGNELKAKLKELKMDKEIKVLEQFYFNR